MTGILILLSVGNIVGTVLNWVESWPLIGSGKIQKFILREAFLRGDHDAGIG